MGARESGGRGSLHALAGQERNKNSLLLSLSPSQKKNELKNSRLLYRLSRRCHPGALNAPRRRQGRQHDREAVQLDDEDHALRAHQRRGEFFWRRSRKREERREKREEDREKRQGEREAAVCAVSAGVALLSLSRLVLSLSPALSLSPTTRKGRSLLSQPASSLFPLSSSPPFPDKKNSNKISSKKINKPVRRLPHEEQPDG